MVDQVDKEPAQRVQAGDGNLSQFLKQVRSEMTKRPVEVGEIVSLVEEDTKENRVDSSASADMVSAECITILSDPNEECKRVMTAGGNDEQLDVDVLAELDVQVVVSDEERAMQQDSLTSFPDGRATPGYKPNNWGVFSQ